MKEIIMLQFSYMSRCISEISGCLEQSTTHCRRGENWNARKSKVQGFNRACKKLKTFLSVFTNNFLLPRLKSKSASEQFLQMYRKGPRILIP